MIIKKSILPTVELNLAKGVIIKKSRRLLNGKRVSGFDHIDMHRKLRSTPQLPRISNFQIPESVLAILEIATFVLSLSRESLSYIIEISDLDLTIQGQIGLLHPVRK